MSTNKTQHALDHLEAFGKWLGRPSAEINQLNLELMKVALLQLGVNSRGWRLFIDYHKPLRDGLAGYLIFADRPLASIENLAKYLSLLQQCEMDIVPPAAFEHAWFMHMSPKTFSHMGTVPIDLFRASWKACAAAQDNSLQLSAFLNHELPDVIEWFYVTKCVDRWDNNQLKSGWAYFRRHEQAWRERCRHTFDGMASDWSPLLTKSVLISGISFHELSSVEAVSEEGEVMRHCIETYLDRCFEDDYRIFSIRNPETGERLATVGMEREKDEWVIDDIKAQDNEEASRSLTRPAALLRDQINDAIRVDAPRIPERYRPLVAAFSKAGNLGYQCFPSCARVALNDLKQHYPDVLADLTLNQLKTAYQLVIDDLQVDQEEELAKMTAIRSLDDLPVFVAPPKNDRQKNLFSDQANLFGEECV